MLLSFEAIEAIDAIENVYFMHYQSSIAYLLQFSISSSIFIIAASILRTFH